MFEPSKLLKAAVSNLKLGNMNYLLKIKEHKKGVVCSTRVKSGNRITLKVMSGDLGE